MQVLAKEPNRPTWKRPTREEGFGSLGEFAQELARYEIEGRFEPHPRLEASISGLGEVSPSDGGFLVQADLAQELIYRIYGLGQVASRVQRISLMKKNSYGLKVNTVDEDSRVDGSRWGGAQAFWLKEGDTLTPSKPKFRQIELQLQKLMALCYVTNEEIEDAGALEIALLRGFTEEIIFQLEDKIFNGTGVGEPLGILNHASAFEVTKDSGDFGATVSATDALNMWSRLWPPSRENAAWFINPDIEPKLYPLIFPAATGSVLLYTPPGQSGDRYGRLLGAPVIPVEYAATLGTPGDIILADLSQYVVIDKGGPVRNFSIHVNFLQDEGVFKFIYRVDGQPVWKKPLTPKYGSNQLAPFVFLSARS
jgi:HK97 family phage major capsid protein